MVEKTREQASVPPLTQEAISREIESAGYDRVVHPVNERGIRVFVLNRRAFAVNLEGLVGWQQNSPKSKRFSNYDHVKSAIENLNRRTAVAKALLRVPDGQYKKRAFIRSKQDKLLTSLKSQVEARAKARSL